MSQDKPEPECEEIAQDLTNKYVDENLLLQGSEAIAQALQKERAGKAELRRQNGELGLQKLTLEKQIAALTQQAKVDAERIEFLEKDINKALDEKNWCAERVVFLERKAERAGEAEACKKAVQEFIDHHHNPINAGKDKQLAEAEKKLETQKRVNEQLKKELNKSGSGRGEWHVSHSCVPKGQYHGLEKQIAELEQKLKERG